MIGRRPCSAVPAAAKGSSPPTHHPGEGSPERRTACARSVTCVSQKRHNTVTSRHDAARPAGRARGSFGVKLPRRRLPACAALPAVRGARRHLCKRRCHPAPPAAGALRSRSLIVPPAMIAGEPVPAPSGRPETGASKPIDPVALPREDPGPSRCASGAGTKRHEQVRVAAVSARKRRIAVPLAARALPRRRSRAPVASAEQLDFLRACPESQAVSPPPACEEHWMRCCAERPC